MQTNGQGDTPVAQKRTRGGAWKDHWVAMLIEVRGCMNDDFLKPQKQGVDMWTRVASELAIACNGFDKDSESCRKKWQKVYKAYKEDRSLIVAGNKPQSFSCKWFHLVDKYMQNRLNPKCHSHSSGTGEQALLNETPNVDTIEVDHGQTTCVESAHTDPTDNLQEVNTDSEHGNNVDSPRLTCSGQVAVSQTCISHEQNADVDNAGNAKRRRKDPSVEDCLSQMAETWKDALDAMKEADARRLEVLQSLAVTMAGLLDVLRKW